MNTHIQRVWRKAKQPILVGLSTLVIGGLLGIVFPPEPPRYACPAPGHLRAHFLERNIAFAPPRPVIVSSSATSSSAASSPRREILRPAAAVETAFETSGETSESPAEGPSPSSGDGSSSDASSVTPTSSSASSLAPILSASSSSLSSTSASSSSATQEQPVPASSVPSEPEASFPEFDRAVFPVGRIPNWGAMKTPSEWNQTYDDMDKATFVRIPRYSLAELTIPVADLKASRDDPRTIRILTAKLFYSTRFFGTYDLDSGEFEGRHAGIDLKLPEGMPVRAIGGGRVLATNADSTGLGLHVIVEHRIDGEAFYSIYGHLKSIGVTKGQNLEPGDVIGRAGSTGKSTSPHLHLQIDRTPALYVPGATPTREEAALRTVHPIEFIAEYSRR